MIPLWLGERLIRMQHGLTMPAIRPCLSAVKGPKAAPGEPIGLTWGTLITWTLLLAPIPSPSPLGFRVLLVGRLCQKLRVFQLLDNISYSLTAKGWAQWIPKLSRQMFVAAMALETWILQRELFALLPPAPLVSRDINGSMSHWS